MYINAITLHTELNWKKSRMSWLHEFHTNLFNCIGFVYSRVFDLAYVCVHRGASHLFIVFVIVIILFDLFYGELR